MLQYTKELFPAQPLLDPLSPTVHWSAPSGLAVIIPSWTRAISR